MNSELIEAAALLQNEKNIDSDVLFDAIETALVSAYKKNFSSSAEVYAKVDRETGELSIRVKKEVSADVTDTETQISIDDAKRIDHRYEIGDIVEIKHMPGSFGRIAAQTAKQLVIQRIREEERNRIYTIYSQKESSIISGIVQKQERKGMLIALGDGDIEAILPPQEQIPGEAYPPHAIMSFYILEVKKTTKMPLITLSRSHPGLIRCLFHREIPEINNGSVEICAMAREAGVRTKVVVASRKENVDPVGSCIGLRGARIAAITEAAGNERIDIIKFQNDTAAFIQDCLGPVPNIKIDVDKEQRLAKVSVPKNQLSLAIGKDGQNVRLAARITGFKIDIQPIVEEIQNDEE